MQKIRYQKKPNNLILFFLILFLFQMFGIFFLLLEPNLSQAATTTPIKFTPQVPIGDYYGDETEISGTSIGEYIQAVYKYAIGIVGIVAAAVIMWSGFMWITAGGNPQKITEAKSWLTGALSGLMLAMTSFLILQTVNPELIKIKPIGPDPVKGIPEADPSIVEKCTKQYPIANYRGVDLQKNIRDLCITSETAKQEEAQAITTKKTPTIQSCYKAYPIARDSLWQTNKGMRERCLINVPEPSQ